MDFTEITEEENAGKLIIFEANSAMRNSLVEVQKDSPEYLALYRAIEAACNMFANRAEVDAWEYKIGSKDKTPVESITSDELAVQKLRILGGVESVGYRGWFWNQLSVYKLEGWIKKVDKDNLEAVVYGNKEAIELLIEACKTNAPSKPDVVKSGSWIGKKPTGQSVIATDTDLAIQKEQDLGSRLGTLKKSLLELIVKKFPDASKDRYIPIINKAAPAELIAYANNAPTAKTLSELLTA